MKNMKPTSKMAIVLAIAGISLSACEQATKVMAIDANSVIAVSDSGVTTLDQEAIKSLQDLGDGELTTDQIQWLQFMREEEKLAGDVYKAFYELYKIPVFKNISKAEDNHASTVLAYLNAWEIEDPASTESGIFQNEELQELYNSLIEQGQAGLIEALKVGALIEEVDIVDLAKVHELDAGEAFENLSAALTLGSRNHLRAFYSQLKFRGIEYEASVLGEDELKNIVTSPWERGTGFCLDTRK
jgi:hypothetical protein